MMTYFLLALSLAHLGWGIDIEIPDIEVPDSPNSGYVNTEHRRIGCFQRKPWDTNDAPVYMDKTCVTEGERLCRGGLPFYRLPLQEGQSFLDCFTFCLSKGLDLSGIVAPEMECRCGASMDNIVWGRKTPRQHLLLPSNTSRIEEDNCSIVIWQYAGGLKDGAVPQPLVLTHATDTFYIMNIVEGKNMAERYFKRQSDQATPPIVDMSAKIGASNTSRLQLKGLCEDHYPTGIRSTGAQSDMPCSQAKNWCNAGGALGAAVKTACPLSCGICSHKGSFAPCYPHNCGGGGGFWHKNSDGNAYIPYTFQNGLDNDRKEAFRAATKMWMSKADVCVRFYESSSTEHARLLVAHEREDCDSAVGFPGDGKEAIMNLGWCNNVNAKGNIAHELGHAMGMNHEQQRPDAAHHLHTSQGTKGPYISIKWENIDSKWQPQYHSSEEYYIGSSTEGYAQYDFESIMHYGQGTPHAFDCVNPVHCSSVGQRHDLSAGDVQRVVDMYQCGRRRSSTPRRRSTKCTENQVDRRRRKDAMCSCRRRDGPSSTGRYSCVGNTIEVTRRRSKDSTFIV